MLFSKSSQLMLRHSKKFKRKRVFFSGNIQDSFPIYLSTLKTKINFQKYSDYINFKKNNVKNINIYNNLLVSDDMVKNCDTIIYYWPKNKSEAQFQFINLISCLPINTQIFIVGDNSSGIKSAPLILKKWITLYKIDNAKHSILMTGLLERKKKFILEDFFKTHVWENFSIKSLPGVFGNKKIDEGSKLLVSTFSKNITGKILDVGCGTGFLSVSLLHRAPNVMITLIDNNIVALKCSEATLDINKLSGRVLCSDFYSNISEKFDLIISNPPFHDDLKVNFDIVKKIVCDSVKHLNFRGELRFVTNSCFNYHFLLKKMFKKYFIITRTNKYKIYQAFLN
ncbi:16S rRNA (guanine(1207)-N(2))-methyltransferase RsmC [Buchnera aphidicola]|uniref:16S rRNA (guanine(1207)-N(2))-methyltransferase RsmC n=1 Tax=Buchnera aphidicola TaxID=9 RepID=UPI003464AEF6